MIIKALSVLESISKNNSGYDIKEMAKIIKDDNIVYEAQPVKSEIRMDIIYSPNRKLVKKISKKRRKELIARKRKHGMEILLN